jgi:hypothetical protein
VRCFRRWKIVEKLNHNFTLRAPLLTASEASTNDDVDIAIAVTPATAAPADINANINTTNAETDEINLRTLEEFRNRELVEKLVKA